MNCANHPDRERAAFCQNCGKPLCTECVRNVGTSVFCEPCLAARVAATAPPAGYGYSSATGYAPGPGGYAPPGPPAGTGEPNPGLAALLGFIPGVGAMYNEQYAKGIVHLIVFAILVTLVSDVNDIFLLFVFGWEFYQAIEAHHTARARRDGTPLPNPFGLNELSERLGFGKAWPSAPPASASFIPGADPNAPFNPTPGPNAPDPNAPNPTTPPTNPYTPPYGYSYVPPVSHWGAPQDAYTYGAPPIPPVPPVPPMPPYANPDFNPNLPYYRRFPGGAIWLIVLGVFFLVGNSGVFHFLHARFFFPILLIVFGVWTFVHRMTGTGAGLANDGTPAYHWRLARAARGSFWMIFIGVVWLLDALHILYWSHSWPLFLIAGGIMLFFKRTLYGYGGYGVYPPAGYGAYPNTPPPTPPVTATGLIPSDPRDSLTGARGDDPRSDSEGR